MTADKTPDFGSLASQFSEALLTDVIPFWERHSIDRECGGYFTCLDREGRVYDTDKFTWLQARQAWMFSHLFLHVERKPEWLEVARHGVEFLRRFGRDDEGSWHFSMTREGRPLTQPHSIFSDCFAAMAFSAYALATGEQWSRDIAGRSLDNILRRRTDPKGRYSKAVPGTRPLKRLAVPMIIANVTDELAWMLDGDQVETLQRQCEQEVFGVFLDPETGLVHESVVEGELVVDCFDTRLINPGHTVEAMWFLMQIGEKRNDPSLIERAAAPLMRALEFGWDQSHGGIFYYMDAKGRPPEKLEWDQKLWWVHAEALVALLMAHRLTGRGEFWHWFERVHSYTWAHFPDSEFGEWFGYLSRSGEVILDLKGGKWKGCFHVPRSLLLCERELRKLSERGGGEKGGRAP
jgi:N-acylglucosamine 2-epimerase